MEITPAQWVMAAVGFLGGGAVGALITQIVTSYRSRRQPIRYQLRTTSIFAGRMDKSFGSVTKLVVEEDDRKFEYSNLHTVELTVENSGNSDFEKFNFGVTLPAEHSTVRINCDPPDRHHLITISGKSPDDTNPQAIDIALEPFNRRDRYTVIFQVSVAGEGSMDKPMRLSTPHPITFVRVADRSDIANIATIAAEVAFPSFASVVRLLGK